MVALIVIGAIALLIFILLSSSIRVDMEYDGVFKYRVRYLLFTFVKNPLSPRQIKKKQKKEQRKKKKQEKKDTRLNQPSDTKSQEPEVIRLQKPQTAKQKNTEKKQEQDKPAENTENTPKNPKIKFSLDLIKRIIGRASPHVKRIFKKIRFSNVMIDITVGGDDAAKVAISYGVHCSAVYGLIAFLDSVISFNAERVSVRADFDLPKSEYYAKAAVKLRLSTLLHSGIWGFFAVLLELRRDSGAGAQKSAPTQDKAA